MNSAQLGRNNDYRRKDQERIELDQRTRKRDQGNAEQTDRGRGGEPPERPNLAIPLR